jgi:arylsulfatase A-like enzyme
MTRDQLVYPALLVSLLLSISGTALGGEKPNVLLIINDQHNGSIMTQRGYPYVDTPAIDRLAAEGVTFTRAYTTYPICKAMRYSLMTGMMVSQVCPDCSGKFQNVTSRKSLGTRMREAGYETAYFGKWHVGQTGLGEVADWHGFDTYIDHSSSKGGDTYTRNNILGWLREEREGPFFLVASFMNPHDSAELGRAIAGFREGITFKDEPVDWQGIDVEKDAPPLPANFGVMENEPEGFTVRRPQGPDEKYWSSHPTAKWTEEDWRRYMWGYDRLVEMMDAHVGLVLDELEKQGLMDDTVIIFTSDHGDGHASHRWNMKMSFYEESVNIPFIVSWRGETRGGVIDEETLVSNTLDINATLLALAGVEKPDHFRGLDLMPLVLEQPGAETFEPRDFVVTEMLQVDMTGRMVAGPDYKYILFDSGDNPEVLFDLANDPGELKNVVHESAYQDELAMARRTLRDWVRETGDPFNIDSIPGMRLDITPAKTVSHTFIAPSAAAVAKEVKTWGEGFPVATEKEAASPCDGETQGRVRLDIAGEPGDAFKIYLHCGDETVAKCHAVVRSGATEASCSDGPRRNAGGFFSCSVKPGMNNSPAAKLATADCR